MTGPDRFEIAIDTKIPALWQNIPPISTPGMPPHWPDARQITSQYR